jgi:Type III restriction enzyme, res subunit
VHPESARAGPAANAEAGPGFEQLGGELKPSAIPATPVAQAVAPLPSRAPASLFPRERAQLRPPRLDQRRALDALHRSVASGHKRPMLQGPTGFGKTPTAAHIIVRAPDKGNRVAFVVPALSLIDQTVAALETEGVDSVGVIQADHPRTDASQAVQVCSVQTLARRRKPGRGGHRRRGPNRLQGHLAPFFVFAPSTPDVSNACASSLGSATTKKAGLGIASRKSAAVAAEPVFFPFYRESETG